MGSGVKDVKKNEDQTSGYTGKSIIDNYNRDKFNKATVWCRQHKYPDNIGGYIW